MEHYLSPMNELFELEEIVDIILEYAVADCGMPSILLLRPVCKLWKKACFKLFLRLDRFPLKLNLRLEPEEQEDFLTAITSNCYIPMEVELRGDGMLQPQELILLELYASNIIILTLGGEDSDEMPETVISTLKLPRLKLVQVKLQKGSLSCLPDGHFASTVDHVMGMKQVQLQLLIDCPHVHEDEIEYANKNPAEVHMSSIRTPGVGIRYTGPEQTEMGSIFSNFNYMDSLTNVSIEIGGYIRNKDIFTVIAERLRHNVRKLQFMIDVFEQPPILKILEMKSLQSLTLHNLPLDSMVANAILPELLPNIRELTIFWVKVRKQIQTIQRLGRDSKIYKSMKRFYISSLEYKGDINMDEYTSALKQMLDCFPNLQRMFWLSLTDQLAVEILPQIFEKNTELTDLWIAIENPNKFPVLPVYNISNVLTSTWIEHDHENPLQQKTLGSTGTGITKLTKLRKFQLFFMGLEATIGEAASEALISMKNLHELRFSGCVNVLPILPDSFEETGRKFECRQNEIMLADTTDDEESDSSDDEIVDDLEMFNVNP